MLISLLLGLLFFGAQVLAVVCHFDKDTPIGSVRAIHNAHIHNSPLVNTANPVLLELLIQLPKELVHNPQAGQFSAKATDEHHQGIIGWIACGVLGLWIRRAMVPIERAISPDRHEPTIRYIVMSWLRI